ncbi:Uncharacterised protein [Mycobacteroides abscessus subsp. massiliense]|nr:Uncharacterised protein [Mycobacteroides abscessus subsp. massiliense]
MAVMAPIVIPVLNGICSSPGTAWSIPGSAGTAMPRPWSSTVAGPEDWENCTYMPMASEVLAMIKFR